MASRLRAGAGWASERPDLVRALRLMRDFLPGDAEFGDPYSTAGNEPAQLVGRRLWSINHTRWSAAGEAGLAFLQLAEWVTRREQVRGETRDVALVFTDLVGFSSWALKAGDEVSIELLRRVGAIIEGCIEAHGGRLIKRLGDGVMAVFEEPGEAVVAMHEAIKRVEGVHTDGYRVQMRAGIHVGQARRLGGDYLGVDVNVASRICEAANEGEALISRQVLDRLNGAPIEIVGQRTVDRPGVPDDLAVYVAELGGKGGSD